MKMIYAVIGLLLVGGFIFYMTSRNNKSQTNEQQTTEQNQDTGRVKESKVDENPYPGLRNQSFSVTPDQLHLMLDNNKTVVYGAVMDWDIGGAVATVVAFQTGDASLYISAGQVYIGGYAHDNIRKAGLAFVSEAQNYLSKTTAIDTAQLPDKGCVRFYLLTNKGKYTSQETVANIESKNSDWTKLFDLGNNVITEYRMITEK